MKVKLENNYKRIYTVEEYEQAKVVIASEKEYDDGKITEWAEMAVNEYCRVTAGLNGCGSDDILKAEAYTAKNRRAYNEYSIWDEHGCAIIGESGQMDVCIETYAIVRTDQEDSYEPGILHLFAYLSDIWKVDGETNLGQYMSGDIYKMDRHFYAKH